ncbi:MAG: ribonuclease HII [Gammaproteobacteria bacterium]|nr:ribonuclease HII [Gammaproteobacteria bacterium]
MTRVIRPGQEIPSPLLEGRLVAGIDEAGRGPLAGSVFAAAVILDPGKPIDGLNDSKQLTPGKRSSLELEIKNRALAWAVHPVDAATIDEINILQATFLAMRKAVEGLVPAAGVALIDGNRVPGGPCEEVAIIKGDQRVACISAASILAKVARDREMEQLDKIFPQYGFARHKGYPTKEHIHALNTYGVIAEHRKSYAPVARLLM